MTFFDLLQATDSSDGGSVGIPLAWLLGIAGTAITGTIATGKVLLTRIEKMQAQQLADLKETQKAVLDALKETHVRELAIRDKHIERCETRELEYKQAGERLTQSLEQAVNLLLRQADVQEEVVRSVPSRARRGAD